MNNTDHCSTMAPVKWWGILGSKWTVSCLNLLVNVLEAGKTDKPKDWRDFDEGQIMMARRLGKGMSKTTGLVGIPAVKFLVPTKSVLRKDNQWTRDRLMGAQGSMMRACGPKANLNGPIPQKSYCSKNCRKR